MLVRDMMRSDVQVMDEHATLRDASKKMKELNIGSIPVHRGDRLVGIITDRDIVIRALAEGADVDHTKISECMTSPISYVFDDQEAAEVGTIMMKKHIRRLPVMNRSKRLVGIISLTDIGAHGDDEKLAGHVLKRVQGSWDVVPWTRE